MPHVCETGHARLRFTLLLVPLLQIRVASDSVHTCSTRSGLLEPDDFAHSTCSLVLGMHQFLLNV